MDAPNRFKAVSKDEFFAFIYADKRDIMPECTSPDYSNWKVVYTREVVGKVFPGWKYPGKPHFYFLANGVCK